MKKFDPKNLTKKTKEELKSNLSAVQFSVTQEDGTEPPFKNEFWNEERDGLYVDLVSGEPLFSSRDKYDSGTGWPSFTKPVDTQFIRLKEDRKFFFSVRTEVRSNGGNCHLGHVFPDGPAPTGMRYCINSAALRFIPKDQLRNEGYEEFLGLFIETNNALELATFAGGCFWGMEELFRKLPGVVKTKVGYTGGELKNPVYEKVKTGKTGHAESIEIQFNPQKTSYEELLKFFFKVHNPTTTDQQGNDVGSQYRSAIFYHSHEQREAAEKMKAFVDKLGVWKAPLVTQICEATDFYEAEDFHQDYLQKFPTGYTCHYVRQIDF